MVRSTNSSCLLLFALSLFPFASHAAEWQQPTPQELSMTSEAAAPDAAAVYLFREEVADDRLHEHSVYVRLKILTEEGKKYADVEIPYEQRAFSIGSVAGRTIHSDGSVVPFTGKPYDKMLVKTSTYRYQAKVFSMPDVQVGSILEYKYQLRYEDHRLLPPTWYIQSGIYMRKGHYRFLPYDGLITTTNPEGKHEQTVSSLHWYPILPKGAEIKHVEIPAVGINTDAHDYYDLNVDSVPAEPREDYMPPIHSLTYRVYFQYSPYGTRDEFWSKEGKYWSKQEDRFMESGPAVTAAVNKLVSPADAPDVKLRKIYVEVMSYENTDFTRQRSTAEEKAEGLGEIKKADDIVSRKRGSSDDLTMTFVAMARAAGLKAYLMKIVSRESEMFDPNVLNMNQLDSEVAIVNLAGKDQFFDPGQRYCVYGQLRWDHTGVTGVRQTDGGTAIAQTPNGTYTDSKTIRVAKLTMDANGAVEGTIQVGYTGEPALEWRQRGLRQDQTEIEKDMRESMEGMLPSGLTVKVDKVLYLDDPSKQVVGIFHVQGPLANATAKRMFVPLSIFEANEKPLFTQAIREMPVYFHYGYQDIDQVTITYPTDLEVESAPKSEDVKMQTFALLREGSAAQGNSITVTRNFAMASLIFTPQEYDELRSFYSKVSHKDQEQAIFKATTHAAGN